jgi:multicomponent Na+:H+ antiporter subunit E
MVLSPICKVWVARCTTDTRTSGRGWQMGHDNADFLVPVSDSATIRNTVAHAARTALDVDADSGVAPTLHLVYPISWRPVDGPVVVPEDAEEILERAAVWAREDVDGAEVDQEGAVEVRTATVGAEEYLFSPGDYASVLSTYAADHGIGTVVLDPEFTPGGSAPMITPLEAEFEEQGLAVETAPVERVTRRSPVPQRSTLAKGGLVFATSYAFYLILGGTLTPFNLATGAIVAALAAGVFAAITIEGRPDLRIIVARVGRLLVYFPYLLWEIAKANLTVAYIILHPALPIEPEMQRYQGAVWGDYSVTTLANSITLTPGTLTVDVTRDSFYIHTLTQSARDGLEDGPLERAVRFVFWGRDATAIPTPRDRDAVSRVEATEEGETE